MANRLLGASKVRQLRTRAWEEAVRHPPTALVSGPGRCIAGVESPACSSHSVDELVPVHTLLMVHQVPICELFACVATHVL